MPKGHQQKMQNATFKTHLHNTVFLVGQKA